MTGDMKKHIYLFSTLVIILIIASCSMESGSNSDFSGGEGKGGSMARFTIVNNFLYTVDMQNLRSFDLSNPEKPVYKANTALRFGVETIFPFNNNLFLGTTTGMYIYDVGNPANPVEKSFFNHVSSCDPVVTDGNYAYVTLNSANIGCGRFVNELQVIDIKNFSNPSLLTTFPLLSPKGLAIRNDSLWICDKGLKIFDVSTKQTPKQLQYFANVSAFDIILNKNLVLIVGENGFTQYRIERNSINKLSEILINQ